MILIPTLSFSVSNILYCDSYGKGNDVVVLTGEDKNGKVLNIVVAYDTDTGMTLTQVYLRLSKMCHSFIYGKKYFLPLSKIYS